MGTLRDMQLALQQKIEELKQRDEIIMVLQMELHRKETILRHLQSELDKHRCIIRPLTRQVTENFQQLFRNAKSRKARRVKLRDGGLGFPKCQCFQIGTDEADEDEERNNEGDDEYIDGDDEELEGERTNVEEEDDDDKEKVVFGCLEPKAKRQAISAEPAFLPSVDLSVLKNLRIKKVPKCPR